ncbi:FMN-binding negative transcriptional regulator [Christiangramia sp. SM2212]|uniref:FMN-binding negative transcriptional regulator n=1 Tax=Christiangramia sediminicola TaxID=3073267 RepID=A0ABU1ELF9_9FLAO|nr:FMN-binding negative transcriptional regulator [Christiangramia sp. SM2212]MDR5589219.1 FMN-binding negative transcriptional regulator [Christiangramia sp. SM2212]
MYRPPKYRKDDKDFIYSFIQQHPFGVFIMNGENLIATHIPILIEGDVENWRLYSHIANHNEQYQYLKDGADVLIIFQGSHAYISSSWYKEKDISTWDYSAVHVNAKIKIQSPEELEKSLEKLVHHFEKFQEKPLFYKDIPKQMLLEHLPLITGFWLEPYKIQGIKKLHQSYPEYDIRRTVEKLGNSDNSNDRQLSEEIKKENKID